MNRKLIIFTTIVFAILFLSCSHAAKKQQSENSITDSKTALVKDNAIAEPTKSTSSQILGEPEVPVLCYRRITASRKGNYTVSLATFSAHMKILADCSGMLVTGTA